MSLLLMSLLQPQPGGVSETLSDPPVNSS